MFRRWLIPLSSKVWSKGNNNLPKLQTVTQSDHSFYLSKTTHTGEPTVAV